METKKQELTPAEKHRRTKAIIIACFVGSLVLLLVCTAIPGLLNGGSVSREEETLAPVDPSKLCDTKEEDFDIMEYEGYLKYDRNVYLDDPRTGVRVSVDEASVEQNGEAFALIYHLLQAVIAGDSETYNSLVSQDVGHYESFTQQQLYDIVITKRSETQLEGKSGTYKEYVLMVEYKIHENNGTFRNTVVPDASRPQYYVINDSTGTLLVMDIIDIIYNN